MPGAELDLGHSKMQTAELWSRLRTGQTKSMVAHLFFAPLTGNAVLLRSFVRNTFHHQLHLFLFFYLNVVCLMQFAAAAVIVLGTDRNNPNTLSQNKLIFIIVRLECFNNVTGTS